MCNKEQDLMSVFRWFHVLICLGGGGGGGLYRGGGTNFGKKIKFYVSLCKLGGSGEVESSGGVGQVGSFP